MKIKKYFKLCIVYSVRIFLKMKIKYYFKLYIWILWSTHFFLKELPNRVSWAEQLQEMVVSSNNSWGGF